MGSVQICAHCGEEFSGTPIQAGEKTYCCEACAFEAQRSVDCGGRTDIPMSAPIVEKIPGGPDIEDLQ